MKNHFNVDVASPLAVLRGDIRQCQDCATTSLSPVSSDSPAHPRRSVSQGYVTRVSGARQSQLWRPGQVGSESLGWSDLSAQCGHNTQTVIIIATSLPSSSVTSADLSSIQVCKAAAIFLSFSHQVSAKLIDSLPLLSSMNLKYAQRPNCYFPSR